MEQITKMLLIDRNVDLESAWEQLTKAGCQILYSMEEEEGQQLIGYLPENFSQTELLKACPFVSQIAEDPYLSIDWDAQWKQHGHGYKNGLLHIPLASLDKEMILKPGPGFGDLSHPTTMMMLELLQKRVKGQCVLDIGCGSGILTIAAALLGAKQVIGIDIDPLAVEHSIENGKLNEVSVFFTDSSDVAIKHISHPSILALMNMIGSEQEVAWESLAAAHPLVETLITSGILEEEAVDYISLWHKRGWNLIDQLSQGEWSSFIFVKSRSGTT